jgi:serine/threonine-protein kinase
MSPQRWQQISAILDRLLDLPPDQRPAALAAAAGGDDDLRLQVAGLLRAAEQEEGLRDRPAAAAFPTLMAAVAAADGEDDAAARIDSVGPFHVSAELGRGGMGVVYLAERADGQFQQQVALKLLKRGLDTDEIQDRFIRERQILARLQPRWNPKAPLFLRFGQTKLVCPPSSPAVFATFWTGVGGR